MNIFFSSTASKNWSTVFLRIRVHLSWRTGKHLHCLRVLRIYSTCSQPGWQDGTNYASLFGTSLGPWSQLQQNRGHGGQFRFLTIQKLKKATTDQSPSICEHFPRNYFVSPEYANLRAFCSLKWAALKGGVKKFFRTQVLIKL